MKIKRIYLLPAALFVAALSLNACKTKKIANTPSAPAATQQETPPAETPPAAPPAEEKPVETTPPVAKPNFNFSNIQFEFNSVVLKTGSYQILDRVVSEMKKDPSAKFTLNGHSSAEGTEEHNMSLSVDRANAVKTYLVNGGISAANLSTNGYGESKPVASNATEEGRALNRRVEIKVAP